jgi:hypothetical protein
MYKNITVSTFLMTFSLFLYWVAGGEFERKPELAGTVLVGAWLSVYASLLVNDKI